MIAVADMAGQTLIHESIKTLQQDKESIDEEMSDLEEVRLLANFL